jgi:hypothetical protein
VTRSLGAPRWWDTLEEVEAEREPDPLFSVTETVRPVLDTVEADATPAIADNLAALLRTCPMGYKVVDHTAAVFGDYYGQVRETAVTPTTDLPTGPALNLNGDLVPTSGGLKTPSGAG